MNSSANRHSRHDSTLPFAGRTLAPANTVILERKLVILPEGMTFPIVGEKDAAEGGVPGEPDAGEVVNLALVPVRHVEERGERGDFRDHAGFVVLPARQHKLEDEAVFV